MKRQYNSNFDISLMLPMKSVVMDTLPCLQYAVDELMASSTSAVKNHGLTVAGLLRKISSQILAMMKLSRPCRFVAALIALFSILFMQLAVAGYACPWLAPQQDSASMAMPSDTGSQRMSDCEGMDTAQPSLCHAHSRADNQSLDKPGLPQVPPFVAASLMLVFAGFEVTSPQTDVQSPSPFLTRTTAPPLSIRNCCYRI